MERRKILVVEDEQTTRRMLSFNLKQQGYEVCEAENGTIGLKMVSEELPDLILLDIMMPGENGFEVMKQIRANPVIANIPIIVLTARAGLADKQFAFKAGADEYLTKPINLQDLNARVEEFLAAAESETEKKPALVPGQVIGVFGPQRKMGVTTLAIRLSEAVARQKKHPVLLTDLSLPRGDVAPLLGLNASENIARLLALHPPQLTPEQILRFMQTTRKGYRVIPAPNTANNPPYRPIPENLAKFLTLMVDASHITILDIGTSLTELSLTALRMCDKVFVLTSGHAAANEATDNFLTLARKVGLDSARLLPVVNQLYGPVGNNIVLKRSPIARVPYIPPHSTESMWTNELALQKLSTIITAT